MTPHSRAFTLIELLTVIAIIGILAAIILPVTSRVRNQARLTQSLSNLRQTGVAMALYVEDHRGDLPGRNEGSGYNLGVGDKGLSGSVTARYWNTNIDQLAPHIAPYVQVSATGGIEKSIPCLEDSLTASKSSGTSSNPVLWVLNRRLTPTNYPELSRELKPFGTKSADAPERYDTLTGSLTVSRVWAMIQADLEIPSDASLISAATVSGTPEKPVTGQHRLALFFDWSVGKIPVGTNLNQQINKRQ